MLVNDSSLVSSCLVGSVVELLLNFLFIYTGHQYLQLYGHDHPNIPSNNSSIITSDGLSTPSNGSRSTLSEETHQSGDSQNFDSRSYHKPYQVS